MLQNYSHLKIKIIIFDRNIALYKINKYRFYTYIKYFIYKILSIASMIQIFE